ncbi:MAG: dihydrodipicolinate synthase family protein [Anaerolineaceae bacterium]|nr:dihydrodipicolinate synthase family protein [Anaerolineaceae bacterium]
MRSFEGVWPALVTPANEEGEINEDCLNALTDHLVDKRVDGLYVGGSTGEGLSQSVGQRMKLTELTMGAVRERVPVIVHVGAVALPDARHLARHAADLGAAGISSILPPDYESEESLWRYYAGIAAAAPATPLLAYILNDDRGTLRLMQRLQGLPQVAGAKYTGPDMYEFRHMVELGGERDWSMFTGMDEMCVYGVLAGAAGNIGSTLNFMPGVYREIRRLVAAGDAAGAASLQERANAVTTILHRYGYMGAQVVALDLLGFDAGGPRLPNLPLNDDMAVSLRDELRASEFFQLCAL